MNNQVCYCQDGFRKILPYEEFQLDSLFTFDHFDDFQIITLNGDSVNGELYYSCKVNDQGNELFCEQKNSKDTSLNHSSMSFYDEKNKLHSIKSYYPYWNEFQIYLFTYNEKGLKLKVELFKYREEQKIESSFVHDSLNVFNLIDTINLAKFLNDSNFYSFKNWSQTDLWNWKHDGKGRVIEYIHLDDLNQKSRVQLIYDIEGRKIKELGFNNYSFLKNSNSEISDSLKEVTIFNYFKNGFTKTRESFNGYFNTYIDSFITDSKNQLIEKISWWKSSNKNEPIFDKIPLTNLYKINFEYDSLGRKTKRTMKVGQVKSHEIYRYKNSKVRDLKKEDIHSL
jgi:hypothetical protein